MMLMMSEKIVIEEPARGSLVGCSDFKEFAINAHKMALSVAAQAINAGQPNQYIGNPGIINAYDQTPLVILVSHGKPTWVDIALKAGADPNLPSVWRDDGIKVYP